MSKCCDNMQMCVLNPLTELFIRKSQLSFMVHLEMCLQKLISYKVKNGNLPLLLSVVQV